jgi:hypothetical protein
MHAAAFYVNAADLRWQVICTRATWVTALAQEGLGREGTAAEEGAGAVPHVGDGAGAPVPAAGAAMPLASGGLSATSLGEFQLKGVKEKLELMQVSSCLWWKGAFNVGAIIGYFGSG